MALNFLTPNNLLLVYVSFHKDLQCHINYKIGEITNILLISLISTVTITQRMQFKNIVFLCCNWFAATPGRKRHTYIYKKKKILPMKILFIVIFLQLLHFWIHCCLYKPQCEQIIRPPTKRIIGSRWSAVNIHHNGTRMLKAEATSAGFLTKV